MPFPRPRCVVSRTPAALGTLVLLLAAAACGNRSDRLETSADEVDLSTPVEITEREYTAFRAPANGVLTEEQVEKYLQTSLLQFDLVRKHGERLHGRLAEMEKRAERGGTIAGLRNLVDAGRTFAEAGDLFGGSYIRSARTLGYNPAELEWVRERIAEVGQYLMVKPMHEMAAQSAAEMRASIEQLRQEMASGAVAGFSEADLESMLQSADEVEANAQNLDVSQETLANLEVLRRARPAVSDPMWTAVSFAGGLGYLAFSGLADPNDPEAQQKLDEYRTLFEDALANRVTAGMEDSRSDN